MGGYLTPLERSCKCHCAFESGGGVGVLSLLERQLERCGPENLVAEAPSYWGLYFCFAAVWVASVFAAFAAGVIWQTPRAAAPVSERNDAPISLLEVTGRARAQRRLRGLEE